MPTKGKQNFKNKIMEIYLSKILKSYKMDINNDKRIISKED